MSETETAVGVVMVGLASAMSASHTLNTHGTTLPTHERGTRNRTNTHDTLTRLNKHASLILQMKLDEESIFRNLAHKRKVKLS